MERTRASWTSWLREGPAKGLSRQHRMSRVAHGWVAMPHVEEQEVSHLGGLDDPLEQQDIRDLMEVQARDAPTEENPVVTYTNVPRRVPASLQQTADNEASQWASQWGAGKTFPPCEWPADLGPLPPQMELTAFKRALVSFPTALGLGWDDIHPRALLRLHDVVLLALLRILFLCETIGGWPSSIALVIIALLPKSAGGLRPIGLFPWLPKIWAKVRRRVALEWEERVQRPYLYAGPGRGGLITPAGNKEPGPNWLRASARRPMP